MAHEAQERYSALVNAKIRQELVLKDGVVFNNDYEGKPTAGAVKVPVRDTEVVVSDYDKANGIAGTASSTGYETILIDKDKAMNEIIDGYDSAAVPDNLVADRLDSGGYSLALQIDKDGGTVLLAAAPTMGIAALTKDNVYANIVNVRKALNKANIPDDGKRFLLVTPDCEALILTSPEFTAASNLGDKYKETGAIGKIAGFNVILWNDSTANLQMLAGHPRFATRVKEWSVPVHVQDLSASGKYIGASAVQGRQVYAHKVLRSAAFRAVYSPSALVVTCAEGSTKGNTVATVTGNTGSLYYRIAGADRAKYGDAVTDWTALTSGTTAIAAKSGDIIEVAEVDSNSKIVAVGYANAVPKA